MYNYSTRVESLHRVVAMLVAATVLVASFGMYTSASAANLTFVSDTLTDSDVSVLSNHSIQFTLASTSAGVLAGGTVTVTFPAGFNMGSVAFGDVDMLVNGVQQTLAAAAAPGVWGAAVAGQVLTITSNNSTIAASSTVIIRIGTNATQGVTGTNRITNPTAGSYELVITAGASDTGRTRVAIIDNVDVTAIVNTSFTFTVAGLATSTTVNGTTTTGSTTATAIAFGTLVAGTPKIMAQQLSVTTNAQHGFVVTVEQDQNLMSANGADIDGFVDGAYNNTPTAWVAPTNSITDEKTWGHWGLTTDDSDLNAQVGGGSFAGTLYVAASTTPRAIFAHSGPADGTTVDKGTAKVGYEIQISPLQEAANDYNTVLTYIATPTF